MKNDKNSKSYAIILASGSGLRFNSKSQPKHLINICEVPLIIWTLDTVIKSNQFDAVVVVTKSTELMQTEKIIFKYFYQESLQLSMASGSKTRIQSFINGLISLKNIYDVKDNDIISLIDSNRPFCSKQQLIDLKNKALKYGCACPARPVVNGVAKISANKIVEVPNKEEFIEFVTPEFIQYGQLKKSLKITKNNLPNSLVEFALQISNKPHVIQSEDINAKLTYPEDLYYFEGLTKKYNINIPKEINVD